MHLPELGPEGLSWNVQLQDESETPEEGHVNVVDEVRGEDHDPREALDVIEQHPNINVGVSVSGRPAAGRERGRVKAVPQVSRMAQINE